MSKLSFESFEPCAATGFYYPQMVCYHHLYTRGSHPEFTLKKWNMIPVKAEIHDLFHKKGTDHLARIHPGIFFWLTGHGWYRCESTGKWRHPHGDDLDAD